jgi:regulator of RNase E activity RraB
MKVELTEDEKQATIDAIERFRDSDPQLIKEYEIEFVIADFDKEKVFELSEFLKFNKINYQELKQIKTDLFVITNMLLDKEGIIDIESYLTYFANKHNFRYDGWGAFE